MNPFNQILESTRPDSQKYASVKQHFPLRADTLERLASKDSVDHPTISLSVSEETQAQSSDDEVYSLLSRLQQILGDIDTGPILEKLSQRHGKGNNNSAIEASSESRIMPNLSFKLVDAKKNGKERTARFALSSPVIINNQEAGKHVSYSDPTDYNTEDLGGESTKSTARTRFSRYSLGSNRFSARARQLSLGTLNYVGNKKLLRSDSRQSLSSPDPYAVMSPSKAGKHPQPLAGTLDGAVDECPMPSGNLLMRNNPNFAEFCVIGIQADMINGLKSLENSTLQPTEVLHMYPIDPSREAVVSNLHEYCFPYGAELKFATHRDLDQLKCGSPSRMGSSNNSHGLKYQIMQFTDAAGVVYYAVCVIGCEPIEQVNADLMRNMAVVQNSIAASDAIKRYIRAYLYRRKQAANAELNAKWIENMRELRAKSMSTRSVASEGRSSKGGFFKAVKRTMGISFKPMKEALRFHTSDHSHSTTDRLSDTNSSLANSPAPPAFGKRLAMTNQPPTSADNTPTRSPPGESPMIKRQRSKSFASPARASLLGESTKDDREALGVPNSTSTRGRRTLLRRSFGDADADFSPQSSRALQEHLERSSRPVAMLTERAYCIISDKPMHAIFFQVREPPPAELLLMLIVLTNRMFGTVDARSHRPEGAGPSADPLVLHHAHDRRRLLPAVSKGSRPHRGRWSTL
jgi:hypothetical protein